MGKFGAGPRRRGSSLTGGTEADEFHEMPRDAEFAPPRRIARDRSHSGAVDLFHAAAVAATEMVMAARMGCDAVIGQRQVGRTGSHFASGR